MKMMMAAIAALLPAVPAYAQAEPPGEFEITGTAGIVSDYRFRGVSQTDKEMAVQAGVTVTHQSGLYAGVWGSNLAGWGTFGGSNTELDVIGGYAIELDGVKVDVGLTWYMYPGGADQTDFAEPYVKVSTTLGPANVLAGVAYAPRQRALGRWYRSGADAQSGVYNDPGDKEDNLYLWSDVSVAVPDTPFTVKGHIGRSHGNPGLGPNGTSVAPTGKYWDWSLGADAAVGPLTLGVAYVDTSISQADGAYLRPNFASTKNGSSIAGETVVFSLVASF
jgi:uncharacterized protein (TIGR02001 family)